MRVRHLPHGQDVLGWPLLFVPRCSHPLASYTFYCSLSAPELLLRLFSRAKRFHWPLAFRFWSENPASSTRTRSAKKRQGNDHIESLIESCRNQILKFI